MPHGPNDVASSLRNNIREAQKTASTNYTVGETVLFCKLRLNSKDEAGLVKEKEEPRFITIVKVSSEREIHDSSCASSWRGGGYRQIFRRLVDSDEMGMAETLCHLRR